MAKNLLEKLNTLVQASIRDAVNNIPNIPSRKRLGDDLNQEVAKLRQQLEAAFEDENLIQQQIAQLEQEILEWDQKADMAILNKRDAEARYAVQQIETTKRRIRILQSERDDHQRATHELLQQVNQLEALIKVSEQSEQTEATLEADTQEELSLSEAIQRARQSIQTEAKQEILRVQLDTPVEETPDQDQDIVEADLSARRSRLAKPE